MENLLLFQILHDKYIILQFLPNCNYKTKKNEKISKIRFYAFLLHQNVIITQKNLLNKSLTGFLLEAPIRFELMNKGFAVLCLPTWLWRRIAYI